MNLKSKVIKHWKENLEKAQRGKLPDTRQASCAYCRRYYATLHSMRCNGCPILEVTGEHFCRGTPYYRVAELREEIFEQDGGSKYTWDALIRAIKAELEFLCSLPED